MSRRLSPLFTLDDEAVKVSVSAESLFAAVSNDNRVRVLSSKNKLQTVFVRRAGTFGCGPGLGMLGALPLLSLFDVELTPF